MTMSMCKIVFVMAAIIAAVIRMWSSIKIGMPLFAFQIVGIAKVGTKRAFSDIVLLLQPGTLSRLQVYNALFGPLNVLAIEIGLSLFTSKMVSVAIIRA